MCIVENTSHGRKPSTDLHAAMAQTIAAAERHNEETLFQFAARVFADCFPIDRTQMPFIVRQLEVLGRTSDGRVFEFIKTVGNYFDLDMKEVRSFYWEMRRANKVPA